MGKASKITVGFKYFMAFHMGLSRGPLNAILKIKVGGREAWVGEAVGNTTIRIAKPSLFGGDKAEGGIDGSMDIMMGASNQGITGRLRAMLGSVVPQFRGVTTVFYDGLICSGNPYPKQWQFLMRRTTAGWEDGVWYEAKATILVTGMTATGETRVIHAMNPAHILYEAITNVAWGRGMDKSLMMDSAWRQCADQLYNEGMGLCLRWARQDTLGSFIQTILDHINGVLYVDKFSGQYRLKLVRKDYGDATLPIYDADSGLISIDEATNAAPTNMVNEVVVTFRNPIDNEQGSVRAHNLAAIQTQGNINSDTKDYPGAPTTRIALQLAQRDLRVASTNMRRFSLTFDRRAWHLQPGDVFKIRDPESRGLGEVVVRVGTTSEAGQADGSIKVAAVQDTFSFELNTFTQVQPPMFIPPNTSPAIARRKIYEMPYAELVQKMPPGEFDSIRPANGYINAHAEKPTPVSMSYDIAVKAEGEADFTIRGSGDFSPLAELNQALGYLDTELLFVDGHELYEFEPGQAAVIGNEMIIIESMTDTAMQIKRGCMDTVPQLHQKGELVWLTENTGGTDWRVYAGGEHVDIKVLPWTLAGGRFDIDGAPIDPLDFNFRFYRPYAPGLVMTNTQFMGDRRWYQKQVLRADVGVSEVPDNLIVTWAHRDRPMQGDKLIDHEQGDIGPEPGTTYRIIVRNQYGEVIRTEAGINGTRWVYTYENAAADMKVQIATSDPLTGSYTLEAMRDGFPSWQLYSMQFDVYKKPPQIGQVATFAMQATQPASDEPGTGPGYPQADGMYITAHGTQVTQVADTSDSADTKGANVAITAAPVTQTTTFIPVMDFLLYEAPYLTLLRDGRDTAHSQVLGMVARPSDRLTDGFDMFDRPAGTTAWTDNGAQPWTPWGRLFGFMHYLTNEFEIDQSSDTDGVPTAVYPGDILKIDNELMVVESVNGKRYKVGRGSADTVPAVHFAGVPVWMFDRDHAMANRQYPADGTAQVSMRPHTYSYEISPDQMPVKELKMQGRPQRPYPPGLMLANGNHWYERVIALKADFKPTKPEEGGIPVVFTWAHRNRINQGETAVDHFSVGISPEPNLQYRIWIGYSVPSGNSTIKVTLFEGYTADAGWTYSTAMALRHGEQAGRALKAPGFVTVQMVITAVRDGLFSWQNYGFNVTIPSYPTVPGDKPGGETTPPKPEYPDPGTPNPPNPEPNPDPENPGDGGPIDPLPDPENPLPPVDPEVPPTDPEPPVTPDPDPTNVPGWSLSWDHGWAGNLPNQAAKED